MYKRFLNNKDYLSIITEEALNQLIRGDEDRFAQVEEAAEASIVEYLTDNYEIEKTLAVGKNLLDYNPQITYPVGAHFYLDGKIVEALRSINGRKAPADIEYWRLIEEVDDSIVEKSLPYSQALNYQSGDIVAFGHGFYECMENNGFDYHNIRIPGVDGWSEVVAYPWEPNVKYGVGEALGYNGHYYMLLNDEDLDLTIDPFDSDNWGLIGEYDPEYEYELSDTEYVEYRGKLYIPAMIPNADELREGYNYRYHDPRNANVKKHLIRLALYELHKLISPNNVSSARIADYEASIMWLRDANRCKINPQIPRKLDEERKPVSEIAIATFARDYDPYKNPWQI